MTTFSDEEGELLDRIAIDMALERLSPVDRALVELRFAYRIPDDYAGLWPPEKACVGAYIGRTYLGRTLSATRAHERTARVLARWRRSHAPSRRAA